MTPGVLFLLGMVLVGLAVPVCFYAFCWAVRASFHARCAATSAEQARELFDEARELVVSRADAPPVPAPPQRPLSLVPSLLRPLPPRRETQPRRCAFCGSADDPLEAMFTEPTSTEPALAAVFLCKDVRDCIDRCRPARSRRPELMA